MKKSAQKTFGTLVRGGLAVAGVVSPAWGESWLQSQKADLVPFQGRFVQRDFGYSVKAPPGHTIYVSKGVSGNHGFQIFLGDHRQIMVDAEYNGAGLIDPEPKPCDDGQLPFPATSLTERRAIKLGRLPACLATGTEGGTFWGIIEAIGHDRGTDIMYIWTLQSTPRSARRDLSLFEKLATNFRLEPIDP